jgi:hypothetical protein
VAQEASPVRSRQESAAEFTERAARDEAFRRDLLADPNAVLQRELGITVPEGVAIHVHEETPTDFHVVLPPATAGVPVQLSEADVLGYAYKSTYDDPDYSNQCERDVSGARG